MIQKLKYGIKAFTIEPDTEVVNGGTSTVQAKLWDAEGIWTVTIHKSPAFTIVKKMVNGLKVKEFKQASEYASYLDELATMAV